MKISKESFYNIGSKLNLSHGLLDTYWKELERDSDTSPFVKYLYYLGSLIVIASMTWFMTLGWSIFGGGGLFLISILYSLIFILIGKKLWTEKDTQTPGGLFITMAVSMVPLAVFGLQSYFNLWPDAENPEQYQAFYSQIHGKWIVMELATILAACIALFYFKFPFITAPLFFAAWFLSMDLPAYFMEKNLDWDERCWITLLIGVLILFVSFWIDQKTEKDFSFWGYFFGSLAFWGALNCLVWNRGEPALIAYLFINLAMVLLAILLQRNVLMVFGSLGIFAYLSHLAYDLFNNSILFPFVLTGIGILIIALGIYLQKNKDAIRQDFKNWLQRKL